LLRPPLYFITSQQQVYLLALGNSISWTSGGEVVHP
jgi:hypothetical protein